MYLLKKDKTIYGALDLFRNSQGDWSNHRCNILVYFLTFFCTNPRYKIYIKKIQNYIVLSFFNRYKVVTFFYKSMNKINGVSAFLQKRYIFKIISSKKYSTVFNDFLFLVKQRSSVLTSIWNHSIRLIHRREIES